MDPVFPPSTRVGRAAPDELLAKRARAWIGDDDEEGEEPGLLGGGGGGHHGADDELPEPQRAPRRRGRSQAWTTSSRGVQPAWPSEEVQQPSAEEGQGEVDEEMEEAPLREEVEEGEEEDGDGDGAAANGVGVGEEQDDDGGEGQQQQQEEEEAEEEDEGETAKVKAIVRQALLSPLLLAWHGGGGGNGGGNGDGNATAATAAAAGGGAAVPTGLAALSLLDGPEKGDIAYCASNLGAAFDALRGSVSAGDRATNDARALAVEEARGTYRRLQALQQHLAQQAQRFQGLRAAPGGGGSGGGFSVGGGEE